MPGSTRSRLPFHRSFPRPPVRRRSLLIGAAAGIAVALGLAVPAGAHVTVGADDVHQGASDAVLTFRVPTEETGASTVKVTISFPKTTPLASVKPASKPGWTFTTTKAPLNPPITTDDGTISEAVSQVVYTATSPATGVPDGGFDTFQILVGPLPQKATSLSFPTVQTYSDGKSASWIQPVTDPANERDSPSPTLQLLPAAAGSDTQAATASASPVAAAPAASGATSATADDVAAARRLAVIALVVAGIAVLGAVGTAVAGRRRS
jgi:uncharacterized protein YcnI